MHIAANIDDCAIIIDEFLNKDFFKEISSFNYSKLKSHTSHEKWSDKSLFKDDKNNITMKEITQTSNNLLIYKEGKVTHCVDSMFEKIIQVLLNCPFIPYRVTSQIGITYYEYKKFSGINWHNDSKFTLNYSLYIMKEWDLNWGGETLIDTNRGMPLANLPKPNSLLAIKNDVMHKVCPVIGPEKRKVLQIRSLF